MTNFVSGRQAENMAKEYLKELGFRIVDQNWRTPFCEIDIVAKKGKTIYFFEVKYRISNRQGTGLEYITKTKLSKMRFAAQMWVKNNRWEKDYSLGAIEVSGQTFAVTNFLTDLI